MTDPRHKNFISHRCPEVSRGVSVRKTINPNHKWELEQNWCIFYKAWDSEWGYEYLKRACSNIRYCPYCGLELEVLHD